VLWQAAKIGYDASLGELVGGLEAWTAAGLPVTSIPLVEPTALDDVRVLDIRQASEYRSGHVPGAVHIELGDLPHAIDRLDDVPTVVMCGHGERAMGAASLLARAGFERLSVLAAGPEEWAHANHTSLASGS